MLSSGFSTSQEKTTEKAMKKITCFTVLHFAPVLLLLVLFYFASTPSYDQSQRFVQCLLQNSDNLTAMSQIIFTPENASYKAVLYELAQNLRFETPETPKPRVILRPFLYSQIKTAIFCSRKTGLRMRIRSGGHDFEGSSYVTGHPFFVLDTYGFRAISADAASRTAWVEAGASLGELYYAINKTDSSLAFPAGFWPTVGTGGHISGGGYGPLTRRHGLAADNILDALVMDAKGNLLDREAMGEDFFWAIRGGVGASFGVILAYKLNLVENPKTVSAFTVVKVVEKDATPLIYKYQQIAHKLPVDITLSVKFANVISKESAKPTVEATFLGLFFGEIDGLLSLINDCFPELGVTTNDSTTLAWPEYFTYHLNLSIADTEEILQTRTSPIPIPYFKPKSDFVQKPISIEGLEKMWDLISLVPPGTLQMEWTPLGGRNDEIVESSIPFPHRAGNSFIMWKRITWNTSDPVIAKERMDWMRKFHKLMGHFVANNPRRAYADYRDHDLGVNNLHGPTSVRQARIWGNPYFMRNFDRLVKVKSLVDPDNFFNNEQSIPPARYWFARVILSIYHKVKRVVFYFLDFKNFALREEL